MDLLLGVALFGRALYSEGGGLKNKHVFHVLFITRGSDSNEENAGGNRFAEVAGRYLGTVTRAKYEAPYANFRGVIFRARSTKIQNRDPPYATGPPLCEFSC